MILEPAFDRLFCRFLLHELILQPEIVELSVVVSCHQYKKSKFLFPVHELLRFLLNICFPAKKYYPINLKSDIVYKNDIRVRIIHGFENSYFCSFIAIKDT